MPNKTHNQSTVKKAWENSWKWLLSTKLGWVSAMLIGGIIGGVIAGIIGAIIAVVLTIGTVFVIHLVITPSQQRKERRHTFIKNNASYLSRLFGNKQKRRYLDILKYLKSMIGIENVVTDLKAGTIEATPDEINQINFPRPYGRGISPLQTSFAQRLFYLGAQCRLG